MKPRRTPVHAAPSQHGGRAWLVVLAVVASTAASARGAEPGQPVDLDGLLALAVERHPEIAALTLDADAARAGASASGRLMDPQWMLGAQALGAMPDSADPTMFMFGVQQMFSLPWTYRASRERAALDVQWSEGQRARVEADTKEALWETAARLRAQALQAAALDEQIAAAEAALAFGRARYSAGVSSNAQGATSTAEAPATAYASPPVVSRPTPGNGGMTGMGGAKSGMGAMGGSSAMGSMPGGSPAGMGEMTGGMGASMPSSMGEGLAPLLRLDAEVARIRADRDALDARRAGEQARLALLVGEDAARAVGADPSRFLGHTSTGDGPAQSSTGQPERVLAATSTRMAEADAKVARSGGLPTFMLATDVRVMPEGMVDGVDAELGVTVPLWSGTKGRVDAATASSEAASRRSEGVDRGLADAMAAARADEAAAEVRARSLAEVAAPRARAAWDATVAAWSAGGGSAADLVLAWQTEVSVTRDTVDAQLANELARAHVARLEGQ